MRIIAAPLLWLVLFVVLYTVQGVACGFGLADDIDRLNSVRVAVLVLAAIAGVWIAKITWSARCRRNEIRRTIVRAEQLASRQRREFIELVTFVLGLLSLVGVVWLALGVFMYPVCEGG